MSKKIILVSDNHLNDYVIKAISDKHYDADIFLHCGDSEMTEEELKPFITVRGNNDFGFLIPKERTFKIENKNILLMHGHGYVSTFSYHYLFEYAQSKEVDVVFFGHTHIFTDTIDNGIRYINPGSCNYSRDGSFPSYAEVIIDGDDIEVIKHTIEGGKLC